ncbi:hypothetical protein TNCV_3193901 [Trichonephila clavipes]|nr:hypothetical protein TNCV_3193901 [Trichonephila clavipes]
MGWNQHRRTYGPAYHSNGTLTGRRYADEILRPHVIPYAGAIEIPLFSRMTMPNHIELVWWRTCLKLKQYSVWNDQRALRLN